MSNQNTPKGPGIAMGGARAKNFKKSIIQLAVFLRPYLIPIAASIIFTIVACILSILAPTKLSDISTATSRIYYNKNNLVFGGFYLDGSMYQRTEELFKTIRNTGIVLLCFYGISFILNYLQAYILAGVNQSVTKKFRKEISAKINRIPLSS